MRKIYPFTYLLLLMGLFSACAASRNLKIAERNKETVRLWFEEGWNKNRNEELIGRVFAPDWMDGNPMRANQVEGHEGIRQSIRFYRQAFAESHFVITHILANEKMVSVRYDLTGIHVGDAFGVPKSGKRFSSSGILIYEMEKGRIKKTWQEFDLAGIVKQLKGE